MAVGLDFASALKEDRLQPLFDRLHGAAVLTYYPDGPAITAPTENLAAIAGFVQEAAGTIRQIPLRLSYRSPFMRQADRLSKERLANLRLDPLKSPFISTSLAGYVPTFGVLKEVLLGLLSGPILLEETVSFLINQGLKTVHIQPYQLTGAQN